MMRLKRTKQMHSATLPALQPQWKNGNFRYFRLKLSPKTRVNPRDLEGTCGGGATGEIVRADASLGLHRPNGKVTKWLGLAWQNDIASLDLSVFFVRSSIVP